MTQKRPNKQHSNNRRSAPHGARPPHGQSRAAGHARPQNARSGGGGSRLGGQIIYGVHAVRAALENPKRRILRLLATENGVAAVNAPDAQFELIDAPRFNDLMPEGAVHQGVAAVVEPLPTLDVRDLIDTLDEGEDATFVILDQVSDPHNVGAIIRSACAFGAKGLIMQDKGAPELSGVLTKTASGAADVMPVALEVNLSRCIDLLKDNGFFVIGLDERGEDIAKLPKYNRVALVLGAEGAGLRRLVSEHCDLLAALPMAGPIASLNVSNAAAVALYATMFK